MRWLILVGTILLSLMVTAVPVLATIVGPELPWEPPRPAITSQNVTVSITGIIGIGGFTVTRVNDTCLRLEWAVGAGVNNTRIVVKYGESPEGRDNGYIVYYGNATTCNDTYVSLDNIFAAIYYEAHWQDHNNTWSPVYAQGNYGEEIVESVATSLGNLATTASLIASLVFNLGIVGLAMWRREVFLYIIAVPVACAFGWYWAGEYGLIPGIVFSAIGGYCLYLAIMRWVRR